MSKKILNIADCELAIIPTEAIHAGKRFREDYGDLTDFIYSIKTHGLINPISVYPGKEGNYHLIAGGRRLHALREIGAENVPVRIFTEQLNERQLRVLELAENTQRKDMTWQEDANLKREIHKLQQSEYGTARPGPVEQQGWSTEDTASMLGVSRSNVADAIALADSMDRLGGVVDFKNMKTAKEARNAIGKISEAMIRRELVQRAEKKKQAGTFLQGLFDAYVVGDAIEYMKNLPDDTFDLIVLDPPYGINLNETKKDNECDTYTEVEQKNYLIFMETVLRQTYRVAKPNTFCILWFGIEPWFEYLYKLAKDIGYEGNRIPGIWTKPNGQSLNPSQQLATAFEPFFVFRKGSPILAKPGRLNVFTFNPVAPQKKYHPTQKPLELASELIQTFSFENGKVLVPFLGSGVDILAAASCKRQAMGYDLSEEHKGGFIQEATLLFGS